MGHTRPAVAGILGGAPHLKAQPPHPSTRSSGPTPRLGLLREQCWSVWAGSLAFVLGKWGGGGGWVGKVGGKAGGVGSGAGEEEWAEETEGACSAAAPSHPVDPEKAGHPGQSLPGSSAAGGHS